MSARGPAVSVVLPTHDRMPYLRAAVDSVRAQSFGDWELLVVDDGSTDATAACVDSIRDPRVRRIAIEHTGSRARVRNEGLARARGRCIAFLESDDAWHPRKLETQLAAVRDDAACGWSYTDVNVIDAGSAALARGSFPTFEAHSGRIIEPLLRREALVHCTTVMVERRLIEAVGGFDESLPFCADYDLWLRLALIADALAVDEPLADLRQHPGRARGRPEADACFVRVYREFERITDEPRLRRLCRRQQASYGVRVANGYLARGRRLDALAALGPAFVRRPMAPRLWRTVARALLPGGFARRAALAGSPGAVRIPSAATLAGRGGTRPHAG